MKGLEIKYTIDNFSDLIRIEDYDTLAPKSKVKGVYFLYSCDKELLYIGKSAACIRLRLCHHLFTHTPFPYDDLKNGSILKKRESYFYFAYSTMDVRFVDMVERFLIQKYKPKFNTEFIYKETKP